MPYSQPERTCFGRLARIRRVLSIEVVTSRGKYDILHENDRKMWNSNMGRNDPRTDDYDRANPARSEPSTDAGNDVEDIPFGDSGDESAGSAQADVSQEGLFDDLLSGDPIFESKDVLRPSYTPSTLPHRQDQITDMATILVVALRGQTPSNILVYGKTGTGKTASAKYVSNELETTSEQSAVPCAVEYINCEVTDTQYRVLAQLANTFIEANEQHIESRLADLHDLQERMDADPAALDGTDFASSAAIESQIAQLETDLAEFEPVPMTGLPTDQVYSTFFDAVDYHELLC
jgi:cell division control protein 6